MAADVLKKLKKRGLETDHITVEMMIRVPIRGLTFDFCILTLYFLFLDLLLSREDQ